MKANGVVLGITLSLAPVAVWAEGSWTVCNRTGQPMDIAIAYVNPGSRGGFISEGWWGLNACGGCATVLMRHETSDPRNVFLYAHNKGNAIVTGSSRMCRMNPKHTIIGNDRCVQRGFQDGYYQRISVNMDKRWTTNITPSPGTPGCID